MDSCPKHSGAIRFRDEPKDARGPSFAVPRILMEIPRLALLIGAFLLAAGSSFRHESEGRLPRSYFYQTCLQGNAKHCFQLGQMWASGAGGPVDIPRAISYFERACKRGHSPSCTRAGQFLASSGRKKEIERGTGLLLKACDLDDTNACFRVGNIFLAARADSESLMKARIVFEKACSADISVSCSNLGFTWEHGLGGPRNHRKARYWYRTACNKGAAIGCKNLGGLYEAGRGGELNLSHALQLYKEACSRNYSKGCEAKEALHRKIDLAELRRQREQVISECLAGKNNEGALKHLEHIKGCKHQFSELEVSAKYSKQLENKMVAAVSGAAKSCLKLTRKYFASNRYSNFISAVDLCISRLNEHTAAEDAVARIRKAARSWTIRLAGSCLRSSGWMNSSIAIEQAISTHDHCIRQLREGSRYYESSQQKITLLEKRKASLQRKLSAIRSKEYRITLCRRGALAVYRAVGGGQGGLLTQLVSSYWGLKGFGAFVWLPVRYKQWCVPYFAQCMGNCGTNRSSWVGWCYARSKSCMKKAYWCDRHMGRLIQQTYRKFCHH